MYLAVDGAIGVGKTSLATKLADHFGASLLLEEYLEKWLARFYSVGVDDEFYLEMLFLLERINQHSEFFSVEHESVIADYSLEKSRVFGAVNLETGADERLFSAIHTRLVVRQRQPDAIIILEAPSEQLMRNIALRGRKAEEGIRKEYLERLTLAYREVFAKFRMAPVLWLSLDETDFVSSRHDLLWVIARIETWLSSL